MTASPCAARSREPDRRPHHAIGGARPAGRPASLDSLLVYLVEIEMSAWPWPY